MDVALVVGAYVLLGVISYWAGPRIFVWWCRRQDRKPE